MKNLFIKTIVYSTLTIFIVFIAYDSYSKVDENKQNIIELINANYNKFPFIKSKFIQEDSLGKQNFGWFIFDKNNGKARIEYNSIPLRIIINNKSVMIEQIDLKEKTFSPLSSSPFKFIISSKFNLNNPELNIVNIKNNTNNYQVTITSKENAFAGTITLFFNKNYYLTGWNIVNELGNETKITLIHSEHLKNKIPNMFFNTHRVTKVNYDLLK